MTELISGMTPLAGRILLALIFVASGASKLQDPAGTIAYIQKAAVPLPLLAYAGSAVLEVLCGVLLVIGLQTRIAALALAVFTVVAAIYFHSNFADLNQMIHFMKNLAITGGLLQVVAFGAGAFSIDNRGAKTRLVRLAHG